MIGFFEWKYAAIKGNLCLLSDWVLVMATNPREATGISYDQEQRLLLVDWPDGRQSAYPYIWLRHAQFFPLMGRPEQLDPREHLLPEDPAILTIKSACLDADDLIVNWNHDGSTTRHALGFLRENSLSNESRQLRCPRPLLWQAEDARKFHWFDAADLEQPASKLEIFAHLRNYGIALIKGLPTEPGTLEAVAKHFGPVRQTHFGSLFDIRSRSQDQLGTGQSIGATASNSQSPHTDEGWRHGPPGINLFHCLKSYPESGGESIFVDGIGAAEALRDSDSEAFDLLTTVPLMFVAERNSEERFRSRARAIALDDNGQVRGIRITDRTLAALDLPIDLIEPGYRAIGLFYQLLLAPGRIFERRLNPGELVIFDNHRVLHGRRAFDPAAGERWLQQLSVDREEFQNLFRQLAEAEGRSDLSHWDQDAGALS
jgi:gamma-butyrobetaine dioxygenase